MLSSITERRRTGRDGEQGEQGEMEKLCSVVHVLHLFMFSLFSMKNRGIRSRTGHLESSRSSSYLICSRRECVNLKGQRSADVCEHAHTRTHSHTHTHTHT